MKFSIAPLLLHSAHVPDGAREALQAAYTAPAEERASHLESAARILHREVDLDCRDAAELVGLDGVDDCR
jgi:hypothetical protein